MTLEQAIAELKFKDEQIAELARQNEALDRTVEELRQQIALLQRRLYGPRSEKYHPDQLFLDEVLEAERKRLARRGAAERFRSRPPCGARRGRMAG